jgi:hypothetical protein
MSNPKSNPIDTAVMARLRAPFGCEFVQPLSANDPKLGRWRIHDANDDAIASVSYLEEGYARLIVAALNEYYDRPVCEMDGCNNRIPIGGEGCPEICPACIAKGL